MSSETRKRRRKRHHVKQHHASARRRRRPSWMKTCATAMITSAALTAGFSAKVYAGTMPVPSETAWAQQSPGSRAAGEQPAQRFDIPAGALSTVMPLFERATGAKVTIAADSIGMITSPGVTGTFTPQDALARLLEGTSVAFRFTSPAAVTLELRLAGESVEVSAPAPAVAVSSPKYSQPLRGIPQTIEVIPAAVMAAQGATTLADALRNVPGITLQAGEGGGASNTSGDMFNMRGFNAANSLFVDGVRDDGLISRDVFNLEQVEVFMGPTGSDVGRGTAAGYVNMQTKVPHLPALYSGDDRLWQVEPEARDARHRSAALAAQGHVAGEVGLPPEHAVAGQRRSGPRGRPEREQGGSRRPSPSVSRRRPAWSSPRSSCRQDNVPDYGIPGSAWPDEPLAPTTVRAGKPVDQTNYYGIPGYDYDQATQQSYTGRVEHDIRSSLTFRNQTRYNDTYRDAVITTIQNPAAFNPKTEMVTLARQGNERENRIFSNQTSLVDRFTTGTLRHAATVGLEYAYEQQWAPALGGVGTRAPVSIYTPNPNDPVTAYNPARTGAYTRGWTNTLAAVRVRHGRPQQPMAGDRRPALRAVRHAVSRGRCGPGDDDGPGSQRRARQRQGRHCLQGRRQRQSLSFVRQHRHAAGHGQLHAQRAGEQPEQSQRRSAGSRPTSRPAASGTWPTAGSR